MQPSCNPGKLPPRLQLKVPENVARVGRDTLHYFCNLCNPGKKIVIIENFEKIKNFLFLKIYFAGDFFSWVTWVTGIKICLKPLGE